MALASLTSFKVLRSRAVLACTLTGFLTAACSPPARADGEVGRHVQELSAHLDTYSAEVGWLMEQVEGIVSAYAEGGLAAAKPEAVVEHWEAVAFHAAIETNYIPLYASIWQGLFGVRSAIEGEEPLAAVRDAQTALEQTLWQALGAVKMAARIQESEYARPGAVAVSISPIATLDEIKERLERVVAKYAERLAGDAIDIVQDTYLTRFEGVEGDLIEQDADLVEALEVDFNVTLPRAIEDAQPIDRVREVVAAMQAKLERAKTLLRDAEASRSSVF